MYEYIIRAMNREGRQVLETVRAVSAEEAVTQMKMRGFSDIQLETSDFETIFQAETQGRVSAEDRLKLRHPTDLQRFMFHLKCNLRGLSPLVALGLAVVGARRIMGLTPNFWDIAAVVLVILPVFFALRTTRRLNSIREVQVAYVRGDFDTVLAIADRSAKRGASPATAAWAAYWKSKVFTRRGRVAEAIQQVEARGMIAGISPVAVEVHRALVFQTAKRYDDAIDVYRALTVSAPKDSVGWMGLTELLAIHRGDAVEARRCFEQLMSLTLSVNIRPMVELLEGYVLMAESRFAEARPRLEAPLRGFEQLEVHQPLYAFAIASLLGHLAIACQYTGDQGLALKHARRALPMLELHQIEPLASRCKAEIPGLV